MSSDICLVHLVWAPLGPEPLRRFVDSYTRYSPGVEHRLLVVFNGFRGDQDLTPWRLALEQVPHQELTIAEPVLDLSAYRQAVDQVSAASYCFLNSYSVITQDGWLELMRSIASGPGVGAVGASGSWGSQFSHLRYQLGLRGPYRRVFPDPETTSRVFAGLSAERPSPSGSTGQLSVALAALRSLMRYAAAFPSFPAPHLRSNCLLIERDLWLRVSRAPRDKLAAYRVESGRRGMTPRLRAMGLRVLVAARDGHAYDAPDWPASRTFWQGSQENLLVEDNQTRAYLQGDDEVRRVLSGYAWGPEAESDRAPLASGSSERAQC